MSASSRRFFSSTSSLIRRLVITSASLIFLLLLLFSTSLVEKIQALDLEFPPAGYVFKAETVYEYETADTLTLNPQTFPNSSTLILRYCNFSWVGVTQASSSNDFWWMSNIHIRFESSRLTWDNAGIRDIALLDGSVFEVINCTFGDYQRNYGGSSTSDEQFLFGIRLSFAAFSETSHIRIVGNNRRSNSNVENGDNDAQRLAEMRSYEAAKKQFAIVPPIELFFYTKLMHFASTRYGGLLSPAIGSIVITDNDLRFEKLSLPRVIFLWTRVDLPASIQVTFSGALMNISNNKIVIDAPDLDPGGKYGASGVIVELGEMADDGALNLAFENILFDRNDISLRTKVLGFGGNWTHPVREFKRALGARIRCGDRGGGGATSGSGRRWNNNKLISASGNVIDIRYADSAAHEVTRSGVAGVSFSIRHGVVDTINMHGNVLEVANVACEGVFNLIATMMEGAEHIGLISLVNNSVSLSATGPFDLIAAGTVNGGRSPDAPFRMVRLDRLVMENNTAFTPLFLPWARSDVGFPLDWNNKRINDDRKIFLSVDSTANLPITDGNTVVQIRHNKCNINTWRGASAILIFGKIPTPTSFRHFFIEDNEFHLTVNDTAKEAAETFGFSDILDTLSKMNDDEEGGYTGRDGGEKFKYLECVALKLRILGSSLTSFVLRNNTAVLTIGRGTLQGFVHSDIANDTDYSGAMHLFENNVIMGYKHGGVAFDTFSLIMFNFPKSARTIGRLLVRGNTLFGRVTDGASCQAGCFAAALLMGTADKVQDCDSVELFEASNNVIDFESEGGGEVIGVSFAMAGRSPPPPAAGGQFQLDFTLTFQSMILGHLKNFTVFSNQIRVVSGPSLTAAFGGKPFSAANAIRMTIAGEITQTDLIQLLDNKVVAISGDTSSSFFCVECRRAPIALGYSTECAQIPKMKNIDKLIISKLAFVKKRASSKTTVTTSLVTDFRMSVGAAALVHISDVDIGDHVIRRPLLWPDSTTVAGRTQKLAVPSRLFAFLPDAHDWLRFSPQPDKVNGPLSPHRIKKLVLDNINASELESTLCKEYASKSPSFTGPVVWTDDLLPPFVDVSFFDVESLQVRRVNVKHRCVEVVIKTSTYGSGSSAVTTTTTTVAEAKEQLNADGKGMSFVRFIFGRASSSPAGTADAAVVAVLNFSDTTLTTFPQPTKEGDVGSSPPRPLNSDRLAYIASRFSTNAKWKSLLHCVKWNEKHVFLSSPEVKNSQTPASTVALQPCEGAKPPRGTQSRMTAATLSADSRTASETLGTRTASGTYHFYEHLRPIDVSSGVSSALMTLGAITASLNAVTHASKALSLSLLRDCGNSSVDDNPLEWSANPLGVEIGSQKSLRTFRGAAFAGNVLFVVVVVVVVSLFVAGYARWLLSSKKKKSSSSSSNNNSTEPTVKNEREQGFIVAGGSSSNSNNQEEDEEEEDESKAFHRLLFNDAAKAFHFPGILAPVVIVVGLPTYLAVATVLSSPHHSDFDWILAAFVPALMFLLLPLYSSYVVWNRCIRDGCCEKLVDVKPKAFVSGAAAAAARRRASLSRRRRRRLSNHRHRRGGAGPGSSDDDSDEDDEDDEYNTNTSSSCCTPDCSGLRENILRVWYFLMHPWKEWKESRFILLYGIMFDGYGERVFFAVGDFFAAAAIAAASGVSLNCTTKSCCNGAGIVCLVLATLHFFALIFSGPSRVFATRLDVVLNVVMSLVTLVLATLCVVELFAVEGITETLNSLTEFSVSLSFVAIFFQLLPIVLPLLEAGWRVLRLKLRGGGEQQQQQQQQSSSSSFRRRYREEMMMERDAIAFPVGGGGGGGGTTSRTLRTLVGDVGDDNDTDEILLREHHRHHHHRGGGNSRMDSRQQKPNRTPVQLSHMLLRPLEEQHDSSGYRGGRASSARSSPRGATSDRSSRRHYDDDDDDDYDRDERTTTTTSRSASGRQQQQQQRSHNSSNRRRGGDGHNDSPYNSQHPQQRRHSSSSSPRHHEEQQRAPSSSSFSPQSSSSVPSASFVESGTTRSGSSRASTTVASIQNRKGRRYGML